MSDSFPEFFVSKNAENGEEVYYKITGYDPDGHIFWRNAGDTRSHETTFYDLLMEERNGFPVERCDKSETPWADA